MPALRNPGQGEEQTQDLEQGQHPGIVEAQPRGALPGDDLRLGDPIEHPLGHDAVLGEGFDVDQTAVGVEADGPQGEQVLKIPPNVEVVGIVERGLGAQGEFSLKYCLTLEAW